MHEIHSLQALVSPRHLSPDRSSKSLALWRPIVLDTSSVPPKWRKPDRMAEMVSKQPPVASSKTVNPGWGQHAASFTRGIEWDCRSSLSCDWNLTLIRVPEVCMLPTALGPTVPSASREGSGLGLSVGPPDSPSAVVALGGQGSGGSLVTTPISLVPGFNLDLSSDKVDGPRC